MKIAQIRSMDIVDGPGVRIAVFCAGCDRACPDCFNKEAQSFEYGNDFTSETLQRLLTLSNHDWCSGLSLLGGEPCHPRNREDMAYLAKIFKETFPDKNIWCWTGYLYEEVKDIELLKYIDVLVDGAFVKELKDLRLKYRGSSNQRVIDLNKTRTTGELVLFDDAV